VGSGGKYFLCGRVVADRGDEMKWGIPPCLTLVSVP
jgi:hypothetical protein